ncbi:DJ-1/PfpI family protein [Mucilaginibacter sp. FT3.2]|uniref:DJ-1/PfpI family protein n=1 Tax=Mucilaginibacter sp. FT3.2 TaxID=2723090 RepID=UPI0016205346|nr:DJ-1/PfpI family protein [Mucilaginibacter sp. FT3.2]MBB6233767.1 transcriptional regulator GlxA family with amidase domain [Mucilaginibacter sp. FT3.2]
MKDRLNVAVLTFDGIELVDMNGPIDVFLKANRFKKGPYYNVYTIADRGVILSEEKTVTIMPQYTLDKIIDHDIIVIPGCIAFDGQSTSVPAGQPIISWIKKKGEEWKNKAGEKLIMSVCVGLYSLAETGLLNGKNATTHYLAMDYAHTTWPAINLVKNKRYVHDGLFLTTGGITSGIDGALYVVEQYNGADIAQQVANIMVYTMNAPLPPGTILPDKATAK